jgi:hypothetical protein
MMVSSFGRKRIFLGQVQRQPVASLLCLLSSEHSRGDAPGIHPIESGQRYSYIEILLNVHDEVVVPDPA